jgi:hypothetical protein
MSFPLIDGRSDMLQVSYRQYATRYEPARRDACLAWRKKLRNEIRSEDQAAPTVQAAFPHFALLLDISQTGASVALDEIPEEDAGVWLRLEGDDMTEWTEARIVGMTITNRGPHLVRLAFRDPCAFETLRAAVCG